MYPPDDPFLINISLFGIQLAIRWYAVFILSGAMLGGWLGTFRARDRGYNPDHVWNGLMLGLVLGVLFARIWYVAFEWQHFRNASLITMLNPATGGLAIHGAIVGGALAVAIYTRIHRLNLLDWLDITAPGYALGQAIGRWGNFFNQEAYGIPMDPPQPWGLRIDLEHRVPAYADLPDSARFHPTFLYESLWNFFVLGTLLFAERRWGHRLRRGDTALLYGVFYSIGRFFIEDLRVDKLCTSGTGGVECAGGLSTARLISVVLIAVCLVLFIGRRIVRRNPPRSAYQPLGRTWLAPQQEQEQEQEQAEAAPAEALEETPQEGRSSS